jgi:SAM-dependent methyltransferase
MKQDSIVFCESKFYNNNIKFFVKNLKNFFLFRKINYKNISMLDFGCGNCLLHRHIKFKKVLLYDRDAKFKKNLSIKNYKIYKSFEHLLKSKVKIDIIIINSVIQYIAPIELKKIFKQLIRKVKKKGIIIISDVPAHSRLVEFFYDLNFFFFLRVFFYLVKKPKYLNLNFYIHKKENLIKLINNKNLKLELIENLNIAKSRYTMLISKNK